MCLFFYNGYTYAIAVTSLSLSFPVAGPSPSPWLSPQAVHPISQGFPHPDGRPYPCGMGYPPAPAHGPQSLLSRGGREHCQHQRNEIFVPQQQLFRVASSSQRRERRGVGSRQNVGASGYMTVQCITLQLTILWCKGTPHRITIFWHKAMPNNFACSLIILYDFCHAILCLHASPLIIAISGQESAPCHFAAQCYDLFPPAALPQAPRQHPKATMFTTMLPL